MIDAMIRSFDVPDLKMESHAFDVNELECFAMSVQHIAHNGNDL